MKRMTLHLTGTHMYIFRKIAGDKSAILAFWRFIFAELGVLIETIDTVEHVEGGTYCAHFTLMQPNPAYYGFNYTKPAQVPNGEVAFDELYKNQEL